MYIPQGRQPFLHQATTGDLPWCLSRKEDSQSYVIMIPDCGDLCDAKLSQTKLKENEKELSIW